MNEQLYKYKYSIILIFTVILVIVAGSLFFINRNESENMPANIGNGIEESSSNSDIDFEILPPEEPTTPAPQIHRPIVFPAGTPDNIKAQLQEDFNRVVKTLEEDHLEIAAWNELGSLRKGIEDYMGAVEAWEYALLLSPENMVIALNLAGVHGYFLRDFAEAEKYYYKAIEYNSGSLQAYGQAYEFFSGVLKDREKATGVIDLGIKNNPDNSDLKEFRNQITGE